MDGGYPGKTQSDKRVCLCGVELLSAQALLQRDCCHAGEYSDDGKRYDEFEQTKALLRFLLGYWHVLLLDYLMSAGCTPACCRTLATCLITGIKLLRDTDETR